MTTKNLDELKDKLYEAFDTAVSRSASIYGDETAKAQYLKSAAATAEAIVAIEREQREAQEVRSVRLPGKN
jgi:hypothetical protein